MEKKPVLEFLLFRKMIAQPVLQFLFWLYFAACVFGGLWTAANGALNDKPDSILNGLLIMIFGPIAVRIFFEFVLLFFTINDTLLDIKEKLAEQSPSGQNDEGLESGSDENVST